MKPPSTLGGFQNIGLAGVRLVSRVYDHIEVGSSVRGDAMTVLVQVPLEDGDGGAVSSRGGP